MRTDSSVGVSRSKLLIRIVAHYLVATILLYLLGRYLIYWQGLPPLTETIGSLFSSDSGITQSQQLSGLLFLLAYLFVFAFIVYRVVRSSGTSLVDDAERIKGLSYYIIRVAFWAVFLVGVVDAVISFLRVEDLLSAVVGEDLADILNQAKGRQTTVHYPIIALSFVIAWFSRSLGFIWLALLVVIAEFTIVLTRFIFSYEQAFMGDLVRFWYAAFFLFASAYALIEGGHVRVDVMYARFSARKRAWVNAIGSMVLGLPLCWIILHSGMGSRQSSLISPILSYEVSPSGYGMYIKYFMAGFLIIYAVSMAFIFISYFLSSAAYLYKEDDAPIPAGGEH